MDLFNRISNKSLLEFFQLSKAKVLLVFSPKA